MAAPQPIENPQRLYEVFEKALVGFQGLMLKGASETRKSLIRPLKNNGF
jgi:hypothetical protein